MAPKALWPFSSGLQANSATLYPASEQDIADIILFRREEGTEVKAVGSRGSKNSCYVTRGSQIRLDRYNQILSVDGKTVTAQAGATVGGLNAVLRRHDLALPTHGEWTGATLAGAVATGTHGGSISHGIFSASVLSIRMIAADATVKEFRRDSESFEHVGVSLGALGIISTITFECEERFCLEMELGVLPFQRYLTDHDHLVRDNEFFSAVWSPWARRVLTFRANRVPVQPASGERRERFCLRHCLHNLLASLPGFDAFPLDWSGLTAVSECYDILCPVRAVGGRARLLRFLGKFVKATELAVPLSRGLESITQLDKVLRLHPKALAHPIGLRATAADLFSMSPAFGRDTLWIDLFFFPDRWFEEELRQVFDEIGARCHWGKHLALTRDQLKRQHPLWDAFWRSRNELDPNRVFANDFTRSLDS